MSRFTLITALMLASGAGAAAEAQTALPIVQVGVVSYRADGSVSGIAYSSGPALDSVTYVSGGYCTLGGGNRQPPADASDVWRVSGKVLSATAAQAVVQLEWQRVLARGQAVNGSPIAQEITLAAGDRVQLDTVTPDAASRCAANSIALEARYAASMVPRSAGPGGGGRGGGVGVTIGSGAGAGGGRAQAGAADGGGVSSSGVVGTGATLAGDVVAGRAVRAAAAGAGLFDVDLWLVHGAPGQADEVVHQVLRANRDGASFAFAPLAIQTAQGAAVVQVTGSFSIAEGSSSPAQLVFATNRRVTFSTADQRGRAANQSIQGSSRSRAPMPGPDDVLSFQLPPPLLDGQAVMPDQLSVRVRVTPR